MFLFFSLFLIFICYPVESANNNDMFYYFAYGSNLLAKRIHIRNPSAVFFSAAKLEGHRLDFKLYTDNWKGAAATIVEDDDHDVWGALWTLDNNQMNNLDDQEGVQLGEYFPKNVTVITPEGNHVSARTYVETDNPEKLQQGEDLPLERRPSNTYLEVIALGAIESHLPPEYIGYIFSFPTNGEMATKEMRNLLGYPF